MEIEMKTFKVHPYFCVDYKHMDIINIIYLLFKTKYHDILFMSDIMSWMFVKTVMKYRGYTLDDIELIHGNIKTKDRLYNDRIWIHDIKENYYIDFTSEYFLEDHCLCSNKIAKFNKYIPLPSEKNVIQQFDATFHADYDIIEDEGTIYDMMVEIEKKMNKRGGKSKKRKMKRRKTQRRKST